MYTKNTYKNELQSINIVLIDKNYVVLFVNINLKILEFVSEMSE